MAGPEDEMAASAAGGRLMRASDADREQVIEALKVAFMHGRMTKGELEPRVGRALAARTCAELAALTADIPPVPAAPGPIRPWSRPGAGRWPPRPPGPAAAWPLRRPLWGPASSSIRAAPASIARGLA